MGYSTVDPDIGVPSIPGSNFGILGTDSCERSESNKNWGIDVCRDKLCRLIMFETIRRGALLFECSRQVALRL